MFVTPAYAEEAAPAPGEVHTETGVAPGHHASFPPFDPKTFPSALLWLVITFAIFYIVMQKVLVPRVGGILESRHARIAQDVEEAARLKAEADAAVATYERELAEARAKSMLSVPQPAPKQRRRRKPNAVPSRQAWPKRSRPPKHGSPKSRRRHLPTSALLPKRLRHPWSSS